MNSLSVEAMVSDSVPGLARVLCRFLGHDWRSVASDDETTPSGLAIHEAPTGAEHEVCGRCGELRVRDPREVFPAE